MALTPAVVMGATAAAVGGFLGADIAWGLHRKRHVRASLRSGVISENDLQRAWASSGVSCKVIEYALRLQRAYDIHATSLVIGGFPRVEPLGKRILRHAAFAGVGDEIRPRCAAEASARMACAGALVGALLGVVASTEACVLLAFAGCFAGGCSLTWALRSEARTRARSLEFELPEMLQVLALGLGSGLTFDMGLHLYCTRFETPLASAFAQAQRQWELGLKTREQALRDLSATYDSQMLSRVVDAVIRSLRFGTSVAFSLSQEAAEARASLKAKRQEEVAKVPVKMMIPTGTLILPAMLLLVLGPVLLELVQGS